jgi:hypothetical protein
MPVTAPRPSALRLSLAVLAAVAVLALAVRLGLQISALQSVHGDLADAQRTAAELDRTIAEGIGPPLIDAAAGPPADMLGARLRGLGLTVAKSQLVAATPAGRGASVARFVVEGRADPAALDRVSLWAEANARSAILEELTARAGDDGRSDVRIELDVLVRDQKAPSP